MYKTTSKTEKKIQVCYIFHLQMRAKRKNRTPKPEYDSEWHVYFRIANQNVMYTRSFTH